MRMVGIAFSVCCCTPTALRNQVPSAARRAKLGKCSAWMLPSPSSSDATGNSSKTIITTGAGSPPGHAPSPAVKPTPKPAGGGGHQKEHCGDHHRGHRQETEHRTQRPAPVIPPGERHPGRHTQPEQHPPRQPPRRGVLEQVTTINPPNSTNSTRWRTRPARWLTACTKATTPANSRGTPTPSTRGTNTTSKAGEARATKNSGLCPKRSSTGWAKAKAANAKVESTRSRVPGGGSVDRAGAAVRGPARSVCAVVGLRLGGHRNIAARTRAGSADRPRRNTRRPITLKKTTAPATPPSTACTTRLPVPGSK